MPLSGFCVSYGSMYIINNAAPTTINGIDEFEEVNGFIAGEVEGVSFSSSTLTTGSVPATYNISYNACLLGNTNTTFEAGIKVDGLIRDESHSCATIATGGNAVNLAGVFILTIPANADVKLVIANKTSTQNVIVVDSNVSLSLIKE